MEVSILSCPRVHKFYLAGSQKFSAVVSQLVIPDNLNWGRRNKNNLLADTGFLCDKSPIIYSVLKKRLNMHPVVLLLSLSELGFDEPKYKIRSVQKI